MREIKRKYKRCNKEEQEGRQSKGGEGKEGVGEKINMEV